MTGSEHDQRLTSLLEAVRDGHERAKSQVLDIVYEELRRMASAKLAREKPGGTLETRDLVHEAYLRLVVPDSAGDLPHWDNRRHFYAAAGEAMRRILVDRARKRAALKRGGGRRPDALRAEDARVSDDPLDHIALHEVLGAFEQVHPRAYEVVRLRYFVGLGVDETAEILGIAPRTAKKDWAFAKAWLRLRLTERETRM